MSDVFTNWTAESTKKFAREPLVVGHKVHERPMFSDAGLADLLDRYPRNIMDIHTMGENRHDAGGFRKGRPGDLPGEELMKAVANGRIWINLRAANQHMPEYADLCDELFDEIERVVPGSKIMKRDCGVLISSPKVKVFYHLDIPLVTLWQIRGVKRVYIYPTGEPFARDEQIEDIVLRATEEEIDYTPAYDDHAFVVDLEPGMMANWPQNAPHRIDNLDSVNVSLSMEFMTVPALIHANALYANGVLRRKFGANPSIAGHGAVAKVGKAALARGMKLFQSDRAFARDIPITFMVDPSAPNAVRDIPA